MTIAEMRESSNKALSGIPRDLLIVAVVLLCSTAAFGLGVLVGRDTGAGKASDRGFWIENVASTTLPEQPAAAAASIPVVPEGTSLAPTEGKYVASKNGTKYYLPSCSGAKRIKDENKVWFRSAEEALASGRTPAATCPGL